MRACGGISKARNSSRPRRPRGAVGRVQLVDAELGAVGVAGDVDQQVAEQAVDQPRRRSRRPARRHLREGDLQLVERVVARLVDARRLAGRADEQAGEQVRQRRMVVPVGDQAAQQIGAAQERPVGRRGAAEHEVVAAAGAGVAAVEHELLGGQPRLPRRLVEDVVRSTSSSQLAAGWMLTSMTPGSGVIGEVGAGAGRAAAHLRAAPGSAARRR